jgi:hypothetical protein
MSITFPAHLSLLYLMTLIRPVLREEGKLGSSLLYNFLHPSVSSYFFRHKITFGTFFSEPKARHYIVGLINYKESRKIHQN